MSWYKEVASAVKTPSYVYNEGLLREHFQVAKSAAEKAGVDIHFAVKANHQPRILEIVKEFGFGAECVSGGEVKRSLECGFAPSRIGIAGAAKSDDELNLIFAQKIGSLHVESLQELEVLEELGKERGESVNILLRLNPDIDAKTHSNIRTGTKEDKFGIPESDWEAAFAFLQKSEFVHFEGIHYHVGSQITDMGVFEQLVARAKNDIQFIAEHGLVVKVLNLGGGLGVNYLDATEIPDFEGYFSALSQVRSFFDGRVIVELGRSLVANAAVLLTKVLFTKGDVNHPKVLVDAGMTDLARPALYQAYHHIENLNTANEEVEQSVFGPICESSDCFGKSRVFPRASRGDMLAIHSVGAYGETMQSGYNLRETCQVHWIKNENNESRAKRTESTGVVHG